MLTMCTPHGVVCGFIWIWWVSKLRRRAKVKTGNELSINTEQKGDKNADRKTGPIVRKPERMVRKASFWWSLKDEEAW